jgi:hypothetical protein
MTKIIINNNMKEYMKEIIHSTNCKISYNKTQFEDNNLGTFNNRFKNNKYMFDRFGLLIREKEYNKKSAFGWIFDSEVDTDISNEDKSPVNINIDPYLIQTNASNVQLVTFNKILSAYSKAIIQNNTPWKIYKQYYPTLFNT